MLAVSRDSYVGSDPGIMFDTYLWATLCVHAIMAKLVNYTFYDRPDMSVVITQFTLCNYPSNPMGNLELDLEKLNSFPDQVKYLSDDLTQVKSNQNYMYNMVRDIKDISS